MYVANKRILLIPYEKLDELDMEVKTLREQDLQFKKDIAVQELNLYEFIDLVNFVGNNDILKECYSLMYDITENNMFELKNSNGRTYKVLGLCPFNEQDAEYYENSWQEYMHALLLSEGGEYVVCNLLGKDSWGSGTYYASGVQAQQDYNERVQEYLKR